MTTIAEMVARWESAERPLFKGCLIDDDGCCCAQGDVLRVCGMSDDELRRIEPREADRRVAEELGISTNEIQGAARLEKFYFLPLFGIPDHAALEELK